MQTFTVHLLSVLFLQIEEDDVTNAAYGSDGSFFANDTVSVPVIVLIQQNVNPEYFLRLLVRSES